MLPRDFASWRIVYYYFSTWKKNGILDDIHQHLVEKIRVSVGIIDAQSVKNILVSCENNQASAAMVHLSAIRNMLNRF